MKKSTFAIVLAVVLALCVPAVAFAALSPSSPVAIGSCPAAATCPNYADRNANGMCDQHENGACPGYVDVDDDGVCDNYAAPRSHGNAAPDNGDASATGDAAAAEAPAQEAPAPQTAPRGNGRGYIDADGDGVCDNYQGGACSGYVDADGDGVCDNCAGAGTNCPGYVDTDGDGACDNYGNGACGGNGAGQGHGRHHGGGHGCAR